jgi:hypothetical protein
MRRCKKIIVVDAGADPTCQFEDLGNAIRKIQIDLGIPIEFPPELKMRAGAKTSNSYCAVAKIRYECVDKGAKDGHLVYIKASLTGAEPADILQYAKTHGTFPHETTGNQFFNECQFESYRHLGSFAVETIEKFVSPPSRRMRWLAHAGDNQPRNTMEHFKEAAERYWQSVPSNGTKG